MVRQGSVVLGQRRQLPRFLFFFFELQLPELVSKVNAKRAIWHLLKRVECKIISRNESFLAYPGRKGVGGRERNAAFFVPYLFAECKIVGGKRGVFSLDLVSAGVEVAEELEDKGAAQLIGGVHIEPVVKAGDIVAAEAARGDIPVEEGKIAPDIELRPKGDGAEDVQAIIILRTYILEDADGGVGINGITYHIGWIVRDKGLDIVFAAVVEHDDIERAPFFEAL